MKIRLQSHAVAVARRYGLLRATTSQHRYPKILTVHDIPPFNCRFEVTNPVEAYRVEGPAREAEFSSMIVSELKTTDVLYDIGACIGMITIHAAKAAGCKVVAFEPDPGFRARLLRNLSLNGLTGVQVVEWAVSDERGIATLYTDGVAGNSPSLANHGQRGIVSVQVDSIDNALRRGDIPLPTVIKIDIEGAEIKALRGMRRLLGSPDAPRVLFLEMHPLFLWELGSSEAEVRELLSSYSYEEVYSVKRAEQSHHVFRRGSGHG